MKASSPHATSLSARQTHQFIVVTCGLLVCCLSELPEKAKADESLVPGSYRQDHPSSDFE
jgi:hypothetical protein